MQNMCAHKQVKFLGEQKGEKGVNRYYRCLECGSVLILSENGIVYQLFDEKKVSQKFENSVFNQTT